MDLEIDEFFTKWYSYFAKFAATKLGKFSKRYVSPEDPEVLDYVHEAYMKVTAGQDDVFTTSPFDSFVGTEDSRKTWFCVAIVNTMKDKFKSSGNMMEIGTDEPIEDYTVKRCVSERNQDVISLLKIAKPYLSSKQYKTLLLRTVSLSYDEISDVLGIPAGTAASNITRTKAKLRRSNICLEGLDLL